MNKYKVLNYKKFLFFFSFIFINLFFYGCALFNSPSKTVNKTKCLIEIENEFENICNEYNNKYECAIGVGNSSDEALKDAKRKLAESVFTIVKSSFSEKIKRELKNKSSFVNNTDIEFSFLNFTYLELDDIKVLKTGKKDSCYYAIILWDKEKAKKAIENFKRKADAIMYVHLIEKVKDINLKLKLLNKLYNLVLLKHLENDILSVNGSAITFSAYIDSTLSDLINKLTVAFTGKKFYLITRNEFWPIKDIKVTLIDAKGKKSVFMTSSDGSVYIPFGFTLPINVYLTLKNKKFLIATLVKKDKSIIYISTKPKKIPYELYENGKAISTGLTPNKIEVYPNYFSIYKIVLPATKKFSRVEETLKVKRGFDAYFFREMEKVRYGKIALKADDALLNIISIDGREIVRNKEKFEGKIPAGVYKVIVKRKNDSKEYQIVNDKIVVSEGDILKREYFTPRDRKFYRDGYGFYFGWSSLLPSKLIKNSTTYKEDEFNQDTYKLDLFLFGFERYYTHFLFGGDFGFAFRDEGDSGNDSGIGDYIGAKVGAYTLLEAIKGYLELNLGYSYMHYSYENEYYKEDNYELEYSGAFIGAKLNFFRLLSLEVRKYSDQTQLIFALEFNKFNKGYRYRRFIKALRGIDYE